MKIRQYFGTYVLMYSLVLTLVTRPASFPLYSC